MKTLTELKKLFEDFLAENEFSDAPAELYEPVNYILRLKAKRFRPLLLLMAADALNMPAEKALPAAMAIEVFHNFTLLHDDIMDEAPLRRGQEAVHRRFGLNAAILSGDVMMIEAYRWLEAYQNDPAYAKIIAAFTTTAIDVCKGQQLDMNFETRPQVTVDEYLEMIRLKTAVLLGTSLQIGALLAQASENTASLFYRFGVEAGMAFQIQDDILDSFGDPAKVGKQTGGDILQNKKTYLLLKTLELSSNPQAVRQWMAAAIPPEEKVSKIKEAMKQSGALAAATAQRDAYHQSALAHLNQIEIGEEARSFFSDLAAKMANRSF